MSYLTDVVHRVYHKYQPILAKAGVSLNLDFPDTTLSLEPGKENLEMAIEKSLRSAAKRTRAGDLISISIRNKKIIIADTGTVLSKTACEMLSSNRVKVKSRVGFGTEVEILF